MTPLALAALLFAPQDLRPFAPLDVFQLEAVQDPRIDPAGGRVVYERRRFEVQEDHSEVTLWLLDLASGDARPLTDPDVSAAGARWSPDGERLAYSKPTEHGVQLYVRWMDSGAEHRVTNLAQRPGSLTWSPDGEWIAFLMYVPREPERWATMPSAPKGAEWAPAPIVIDRFSYRADGAGYLEEGNTHLFVVPASGGTPRQLTRGDYDHSGPPAWAPDGRSLFVSSNRRDDRELEPNDSDLYRIPIEGEGEEEGEGDTQEAGAAASGPKAERVTQRYGPDGSPRVSTDGYLYWTGTDERHLSTQQNELYRMPLSSLDEDAAECLTEDLDRSVQGFAPMTGGSLVAYDDRGERRLARVLAEGAPGAWRRDELPVRLQGTSIGRPYTGGRFSLASNGALAYQAAFGDRPAELGVLLPGEEPRVRTDLHADLAAQIAFAEPRELWTPSSHDEQPVQAWILHPPGYDPEGDERYPLLLEIHGGPHTAYGPVFSPELQLMAAAGYLVVYANPRGSTSYGQEFAQWIHHNYPSEDYDDLMSVVDAVLERESVDPARLFVTGGSGGGVLTAWIVGKTERFRAAVVAKPVINWLSFSLTADAYAYFTRWWFPRMPWDDPLDYWKRSPLSLVGNVRTPTMLLTGEEDYRTPISESEQYYQALQLCGVPSAMVRIPGSGHGIASRPSRMLYKVASILAWFDKHDDQE